MRIVMAASAQPLWVIILSLGLTGSIIGAIVAAIAARLNDRSKRRFETQRWRAEFYLRPKLEALRNLHAAMVRSHYELNVRAKANIPQTIADFRELVEHPVKEFFTALVLAEIYLHGDTIKIMHEVLGAVRQMDYSIWLRVPEVVSKNGQHQDTALREPDWQLFATSFDAAQAKLRALLHPDELLKRIENEH